MTPAEEYAGRLAAHEARITELSRRDERIATARLVVAIAIIAVVAANLAVHIPVLWWAVPLVLAFAWLVSRHSRIRRDRARATRAAAFYRRGIDRISDRWQGAGQTGERFLDPHHVYAADLDLFGRGSLFELLSAARTRMGEQTLAQWLLGPAAPAEIRERQACVAELRERLQLREDLDAAGDIGVGVRPDALLGWSESANRLQAPWIQPVARILPALALGTALAWGLTGVSWPFLTVLLAEVAVLLVFRKHLRGIADSAESGFENLQLLTDLLTRLEREPFSAPALLALQQQLASQAQPASRVIAKLRTITDLSGHRKNLLVAILFELPLLYSVQVALAAEAWRSRHGTSVREWLATIGRFEALSSLSMYAYEHSDDPFPTLLDGAAAFEAHGLGHPLLSANACVRNEVEIREPVRTLLVSGSNMSGKSTLLRAVGVNIVLAMAGAPVRATALRADAAAGRREHPRQRFIARGPFAVLRGDHAASPAVRIRRRRHGAAVPAR